jgi:hypothetical protein
VLWIPACPKRGEYVSPYAAGCALCGADLDKARRAQSQRVRRFLSRPIREPRFDAQEFVLVALMLLIAVLVPPFGFIFALLVGFASHAQDNRPVRNAAVAAGLLAVLWTLVSLQLGAPLPFAL